MMTQELRRVTLVVLIAFGAVALGAVFWMVIRADDLLARPENPRRVLAEQRIRRGMIVDRDGDRLAYSEVLPSGAVRRVYPVPDTVGAVGYYSFTYGAAGIEAAYNADLRGDGTRSAWQRFVDDTLHRPQQGGDVRATIDLDVQQAAAAALGDHAGAVVMAHVPSGRVLAMVSRPAYDPNRLDAEWRALSRDESSPLLNRATAGLYQPGGALYTVMLAAILATYPDLSESGGYVLNNEAPDARAPVQVITPVRAGPDNGPDERLTLTLTCLDGTPERPLTLAEAYVFGCPAPFVAALESTLTPERMWERFEALGLLAPPALAGFETLSGPAPEPLTSETSPGALTAAVTGQGDLTVTPLQMLHIVAAIANRGSAVPLHLVDAVRLPGSSDWEPVDLPPQRPALLRVDVASAVRLTMLQAAAHSPYVARARRGDLVLYGHSALAYGSPNSIPDAWFVGFIEQSEGGDVAAIAIVVLVEGSPDPGLAADVAGAAFAAVAGVE